jgi:gamma-glutamylcyclotransferase (GGCT)/AIG2-like uncharacterized protein YtfP
MTGMDVFVYGTLTEPETVGEVVDSFAFLGPAVLSGLHPVSGQYPSLAPGGRTGGRLLRTDEVAALDAYERVDDGVYVRVSVPIVGDVDGEADGAAVYVGDHDRLDVVDAVTWPGEGSLRERVERYIRENEVRVEPRRG